MALGWVSLLVGAAVGIVAGTLIGCIGVGGVVLVPLLIQLPEVNVHIAVVACMAAYVPAGLGGAVAFVRKGAVPWRSALLMCLPAAPAALLGSWTLVQLGGHLVELILYSVMLATSCLSAVRSIHAVWKEKSEKQPSAPEACENEAENAGESSRCNDEPNPESPNSELQDDEDGPLLPENACAGVLDTDVMTEKPRVDESGDKPAPEESAPEQHDDGGIPCFGSMSFAKVVQALAVGTLTGFGSALTGTSGPVLLLPMLFIFLWPAMPALGCAQVIQVPIALAATIGNVFFASEEVDLSEVFKLAACVAAGLVPFVFLGAAIADRLPQRTLKIIVAVVLVVASLVLLLYKGIH